jgi:hypothetical protein
MAKASDAHPSQRRKFLQRLLAEVSRNIWTVVKALTTPKGILAVVPLVVSVVAFLKSSYSETQLSLLLTQQVSSEVTLFAEDGGKTFGVGPSKFNVFEFMLLAEGKETVYVSSMNINLTKWHAAAKFDENCVYSSSLRWRTTDLLVLNI